MTFYHDQMKVDQTASTRKIFTEDDVKAFAALSTDMNPIHLDIDFASNSIFGQRIVHGLLTASLFSALLANNLPGQGTIYLSQTLTFKAPVFLGDIVTATVRVIELGERNRVKLECICAVGEKVVIVGEAIVIAPKRPA
jgi:3-hydroxybutyryl-CoA dehydratase